MKPTVEPKETIEFRLIRALDVDCNAHRLKHYCKRLRRQADMQRWLRINRVKRAKRRGCSSASAPVPACLAA